MAHSLQERSKPASYKEELQVACEAQGAGAGQAGVPDEADTSTSAASSARPARRRRLARRRQYQKPRRIASSYQHSAESDDYPAGARTALDKNGHSVEEDTAVSWCRASSFDRQHGHPKGCSPYLVEARSLELYHPVATVGGLVSYSSSSLESCPGDQQQQQQLALHHRNHQLQRQHQQHPSSPAMTARSMSFLSGLTSGHLTDIGESSSSMSRHNILEAKQQSLSQLLLTERKQQQLMPPWGQQQHKHPQQHQQQQQQQQQPQHSHSISSRSLQQMHTPAMSGIHKQWNLLMKDSHLAPRSVANQIFIQNNNQNNKCIDNVHFSLFFPGPLNESSPITMNHSERTDPRLYKDDVDIKFSRALNSCKLPQIRYASKARLFERLTDLRFLSIDFLNTFLLTYRVFTCAVDVLEALKSVHYNCDRYYSQAPSSGRQSTTSQQQEQVAEAVHSATPMQPSPSALVSGHQQVDSCMEQADMFSGCYSTANPSNGHSDELVTSKDDSASPQKMQRQSSFSSAPRDKQRQKHHSQSSAYSQLISDQAHRSPILSQGKPLVPPRSQWASQHPEANKPQLHLLAPIQTGSLVQKRRSTISALSPITSSEASSMNNLSINQHVRQQDSAAAACKHATMQLPAPQHQDSSDLKSVSLHSSLSTSRLSSVLLDEPLMLGQERLRSSSVSIKLDHPSYDEPSNTGGSFLMVPMGRQQRSNSCSQVRPIQPIASMQQQSAICLHQTTEPSPMNTEHWRLCYKKATATVQDQRQLLAPKSPQVNARRSSSSELDQRQSFRMTLNLSPDPIEGFTPIGTATDRPSEQPFEYTINNKPPQVPPSTPIEPIASMEIDQSGAANLLVHQASCDKRSPSLGDGKIPLVSTSGSSLMASESPSSSTSSLSLSSDNSSPTHTRKNNRARSNSRHQDLIRRSSSSGSHSGALPAVRSSCGKSRKTDKIHHSKGPAEAVAAADRRHGSRRIQHFSFHSHMKEIELNESRLLDYDTSADEDKIFTSSSDSQEEDHRSEPEVDGLKEAVVGELLAEAQPPASGVDTRAKPAKITQTLANEINNKRSSTPVRNAASSQQSIKLTGSFTPDRSISQFTTPRSSFQYQQSHHDATATSLKAGVIVTASRPKVASRRSSTASAASAFAAATAASSNPLLTQPPVHGSPSLVQATLPASYAMAKHLAGSLGLSSDQLNQRSGSISCLQQPGRPTQHPMRRHVGDQQSRQSATEQNISLSNSRASSRLSSCAGLENTYSSSNFQNFTNSSSCFHQSTNNKHSPAMQSPPHSIQSSATAKINHQQPPAPRTTSKAQTNVKSVATIRVLSVLRHWVSKQAQDFVNDSELAMLTEEFLQDLINDGSLLPAEHRAAQQLHQMIQKAVMGRQDQVDLDLLLAEPKKPSSDSIDTLSALDIAECMTYLDHKIFLAIRSEEFLGQAWMKADKTIKAPHILLITKRFNDVSRLVSSEIIRVADISKRVSIIEKWANVAHICRVVHNFNGVLQICAAFTNSAIYRLKKTWDKVSKTTKATIDQLQTLVSTDSRFRNMRDAINRCDPPSIPYVGMYLADLSFIEEGTPNYSPDGLLNFSKMRMIAHVIREIQHLQNGCYKINPSKQVLNYLLDTSRHLQDEEMYKCSLRLEPKSTVKSSTQLANVASGSQGKSVVGNITNAQQPSSGSQQKQSQRLTQQSAVGTHISSSSSRVQVTIAARKG